MVLDGPMTGEAFLAYVLQDLAPGPTALNTVVMDNLRLHRVAGVREAIEAMGTSAERR